MDVPAHIRMRKRTAKLRFWQQKPECLFYLFFGTAFLCILFQSKKKKCRECISAHIKLCKCLSFPFLLLNPFLSLRLKPPSFHVITVFLSPFAPCFVFIALFFPPYWVFFLYPRIFLPLLLLFCFSLSFSLRPFRPPDLYVICLLVRFQAGFIGMTVLGYGIVCARHRSINQSLIFCARLWLP